MLLNWNNLRVNLCPQCGKDFNQGLKIAPKRDMVTNIVDNLMSHPCGFRIRESKFSKLVADKTNAGLEDYAEFDEKHYE